MQLSAYVNRDAVHMDDLHKSSPSAGSMGPFSDSTPAPALPPRHQRILLLTISFEEKPPLYPRLLGTPSITPGTGL